MQAWPNSSKSTELPALLEKEFRGGTGCTSERSGDYNGGCAGYLMGFFKIETALYQCSLFAYH
jgi:hypothetical protein